MPSRDWFTYTAEFLPIGANGTATVNVPIQADSDFLMTQITGTVKTAITAETVIAAPAILVNLQNSGSGRVLMDRAVEWDNLVGTAQRPGLLAMPSTLKASSTLLVTVTENSGNARQVRLAFGGYKIFP